MTVVGKIIAVVNLVLSIAVMFFIVAAYVARTNWHTAYEAQAKLTQQAKQDLEAVRQESRETRGGLIETEKKLGEELKKNAKLTSDLDSATKAFGKDLGDARQKFAEARLKLDSITEENKRREKEVAYLSELMAKRDKDLIKKEEEVQSFRDRAVQAEIASKREQERNEQLLVHNETLTKELTKAKSSGASSGLAGMPRKNPPAQSVDGVIVATDPDSGYVTISIGSDAGLSKGNTLEAYRLSPQSQFLGTLEILAVQPNLAVAKPQARLTAALQKGDRVTNEISTRR